jgi:hypothetical protein
MPQIAESRLKVVAGTDRRDNDREARRLPLAHRLRSHISYRVSTASSAIIRANISTNASLVDGEPRYSAPALPLTHGNRHAFCLGFVGPEHQGQRVTVVGGIAWRGLTALKGDEEGT